MQSKAPLTVRNLVGRNPELIPQLLELGVDGIVTDLPGQMHEWLGRHGRR